MSDELYAENVTEQIRRWDEGKTIFTIELGGLGPGYEQTIQVAAIEFSRAAKDLTETTREQLEALFTSKCEEVLKQIDDKIGGMSGAMFGQSRWLAWQWCFNGGPKRLVERAKEQGKENDVIQCSNFFPHV